MSVAAASAFLVSGLVGSAIVSCIMSRFPYYRLILIVCVVTGTTFYILTFVAVSAGTRPLMIVFPGIMGFFLVPVKGLLLAYCCGVAHNICIPSLFSHTYVAEYVVNGFVLVVYCATSMGAVINSRVRHMMWIGNRHGDTGGV